MSNKDLEDFLDLIPGLPKNKNPQKEQQQTTSDFKELDVNSMLQQRIMNKMQQQHQQQTISYPQQVMPVQYNANHEMVFLKEGQQYYKAIPAQESTMPLAMYAGPISNVSGKEFINKGIRKYYIVEGNQAIDLSNPDYTKLKPLYAVEAPWVGTILVPESAIIKQNNGPKILKD